jgi:hypothetical protein
MKLPNKPFTKVLLPGAGHLNVWLKAHTPAKSAPTRRRLHASYVMFA